ncbi:AbrB/MazE/SpoVT family DNA-binding domain-containing protein [Nanoarchaeota archaeon]
MPLIKTIKVSDKGQIAIPTEIREAMGIDKGDELIILESKGRLLLERTKEFTSKIEDDFKDIKKLSQKSLDKVWNNKEDEIWSGYLKK